MVQPYKRPRPANHQLAGLHALDIADKHHQLVVVVLQTRNAAWWGDGVEVTKFNSGHYRDGHEVAEFAVADAREDFDPSFGFLVCLMEPRAGLLGWLSGLAAFLDEVVEYIERDVIAPFRQFF